MKKAYANLAIFIVPVIFALLSFFYKDTFYFLIAGISLIIAAVLFLPKQYTKFKFKFPKFKRRIVLSKKVSSFTKFLSAKRVKESTQISDKKASKPFRVKHLIFSLPTLIIALVTICSFSVISVLLLSETKQSSTLLFQYYFSYINLLQQYMFPLAVAFALLMVFVVTYVTIKRKKQTFRSLGKQLAIRGVIYFSIIALGFHLSLGIAFLSAMTQVAYLTYGYNKGIVSNNIISDTKEISKRITTTKTLPKIVYYEYPYKKSLVLLKLRNNKNTFYEQRLLTSLPNSFYETLSISPSSLFLIDNSLLITELKEQTLEGISPAIGKLLVAATFRKKNIKDAPKIELLNRQEYLKLREEQINKDIKKLDEEIAKIDREISIVQGYIAKGRQELQEAQDFLTNSSSLKESTYNECKSAGETYEGQFYRYYTDDQCNTLRAEWDAAVTNVNSQIAGMRSTLSHNQGVLADYQTVRQYAVKARDLVDSSKNNTPYELGLFLPKEQIKIALDSNNPEVFNAYLSTLVHEYLHYTSYVSEERQIDHFFEEALTEYFARKVVSEQLHYSENIGYPVAVKIIEEITKKIPEEKLLTIYFTKDQKQLEYLLNEAYGSKFYEDSVYFFSMINYLPEDESLKTANTIMVRIDGKKLTKESIN